MESTDQLATRLVHRLKEKGLYLTAVESCTGGGLANCITNVPGASEVFKSSHVTYSNESKIKLGVSESVVEAFTVYSEQTALAMAEAGLGACESAQVSVGITGSLNREDPHNPNSKVGDVYIGIVAGAHRSSEVLRLENADATRSEAKGTIIEATLRQLLSILENA